MGFTWSNLNRGDIPKKDDIDEIKSNMDSILNDLNKGLNWDYDEFAKRLHMYEYVRLIALRQSIDDLDTIKCNDCSSFNSYENEAACPLAKDGYCSTDYSDAKSVDNITEDTGYNEAYNNNELSGNNDTVDNIVNSGYDSDVNSEHDGMDDSSEYYTARSGEDTSVYSADGACSGDDSSVYSGHNSDDDDGYNFSYCGTVYDAENSTYYGGEKSADNSGVDSGHNSGYYVGDDSGYDVSVCDIHFATEHNDYGVSSDSTVHGTYYANDDSTYNSGENSTNLSGDYDTNFGDENSVAGTCSSDDSGYNSSYDSGYDGTYNYNEDNPYDYGYHDTYCSGDDGTYDSGYDGTDDGTVYDGH